MLIVVQVSSNYFHDLLKFVDICLKSLIFVKVSFSKFVETLKFFQNLLRVWSDLCAMLGSRQCKTFQCAPVNQAILSLAGGKFD